MLRAAHGSNGPYRPSSPAARYMFGMAAVPAVFQALGMLFLPRTPHFLLLKRQEEKAEKVLQVGKQ